MNRQCWWNYHLDIPLLTLTLRTSSTIYSALIFLRIKLNSAFVCNSIGSFRTTDDSYRSRQRNDDDEDDRIVRSFVHSWKNMASNESNAVRIILTPIKIVRNSTTGQWSTPRLKKDANQKFKYDLRVRTPSTPVVSLSSPMSAKKENVRTPRPMTRASRQISFEKDQDEPTAFSSSDDDEEEEDDEDDDDDDDDDEEDTSSSEEEEVVSTDRKSTVIAKGTPAAKKRRPTFLPRVSPISRFKSIVLFIHDPFADEYHDVNRSSAWWWSPSVDGSLQRCLRSSSTTVSTSALFFLSYPWPNHLDYCQRIFPKHHPVESKSPVLSRRSSPINSMHKQEGNERLLLHCPSASLSSLLLGPCTSVVCPVLVKRQLSIKSSANWCCCRRILIYHNSNTSFSTEWNWTNQKRSTFNCYKYDCSSSFFIFWVFVSGDWNRWSSSQAKCENGV